MKAHTTEYTVSAYERKFRTYASRFGLVVVIGLGAYLANSLHTKQTLIDAAQANADRAALRLELIVMSSPEATIMCDQNGVIVQSNYAVELLLGWPKSELVGQRTSVLMPESDVKLHDAGMLKSLKQIRGYAGDSMMLSDDRKLTAVHRDGHRVSALTSIRVIKFMDEIQFIAVMRPAETSDPVIPSLQPVPLPNIPASNVAIERAIITLADEAEIRQQTATAANQ